MSYLRLDADDLLQERDGLLIPAGTQITTTGRSLSQAPKDSNGSSDLVDGTRLAYGQADQVHPRDQAYVII